MYVLGTVNFMKASDDCLRVVKSYIYKEPKCSKKASSTARVCPAFIHRNAFSGQTKNCQQKFSLFVASSTLAQELAFQNI